MTGLLSLIRKLGVRPGVERADLFGSGRRMVKRLTVREARRVAAAELQAQLAELDQEAELLAAEAAPLIEQQLPAFRQGIPLDWIRRRQAVPEQAAT